MKTKIAIKHYKTAANLARALGIERSAVCQWGEYPPVGRQYELQILTGGKLKATVQRKKKRKAA